MSSVHFLVPEGVDDPRRPSGGNHYDLPGDRGAAAAGPRRVGAPRRRHDPAGRGDAGGRAGGRPRRGLRSDRLRVVLLLHMPYDGPLLATARAVVTTSAWTAAGSWRRPARRGPSRCGPGAARRRAATGGRAAVRRGGGPGQGARRAAGGAGQARRPRLAAHLRRQPGPRPRLGGRACRADERVRRFTGPRVGADARRVVRRRRPAGAADPAARATGWSSPRRRRAAPGRRLRRRRRGRGARRRRAGCWCRPTTRARWPTRSAAGSTSPTSGRRCAPPPRRGARR